MSDSLRPHGLLPTRLFHPWDFPGKNTGVGCYFLLQGIFPTQGLNPGLPHCKQTLYHLNHQGSPLERIRTNLRRTESLYFLLCSICCLYPPNIFTGLFLLGCFFWGECRARWGVGRPRWSGLSYFLSPHNFLKSSHVAIALCRNLQCVSFTGRITFMAWYSKPQCP